MLRLLAVVLLVCWTTTSVSAAEPVGMATEGRLDLLADASVGSLTGAELMSGRGGIERMNWLPEKQRELGYSIQLPATHRSWRSFEVQLVPQKSGQLTLHLMGPWASAGNNQLIRQDVEWDDLSADGVSLVAGGFEAAGNWKLQGGKLVTAEKGRPAVEGQVYARTWHNGRITTALKVEGGKAIIVRGKYRSAIPDGYAEMARIESRETPAHRNARKFLRGVNLGNGLEVPPGQNWAQDYSERDFEEIRKAGFDHVRIPIGWHHYNGAAPDYHIQEEIFHKVDQFLAWAEKNQLAVIINIHHFDDFTTSPTQHQSRLQAIWSQLARRYSSRPEQVAFELLNEPKDAATTQLLNPIYAELIHVIRQTNPTRPIFVGPGRFNQIAELANLNLPAHDQNLIVTVHSYDPHLFTHQGAIWGSPITRKLKGIKFPGPPETPLPIPEDSPPELKNWIEGYNSLPGDRNPCSSARLQELVADAREWSEYYGRPIHVGEFGAYNVADRQSRVNYCGAFRREMENAQFGWALWDWSAGFQFWDKEQGRPVEGMPEALFGQ